MQTPEPNHTEAQNTRLNQEQEFEGSWCQSCEPPSPLPDALDKLPEPLLDPMATDACRIQIHIQTTNVEAEVDLERFYEESQDLLELTPKKYVLFITGTGMQN